MSTALDDLSDDVKYWRQTLDVYKDNVIMKEYVAKLYVVVFKFLVNIMTKWSKSGVARFLRSFESNFFKEEIESKRTEIRDLEHRLERQGSLAMKHSVQQAPTKDDISKIVSISQANFQMEFLLKAEQYKRELGQTVKNSLQDEFLNMLWVQRDEITFGAKSPMARSREPSPLPDTINDAGDFYLRRQIQLAARRQVQQKTQQEHVLTMVAQAQNLNVDIAIFDRIQRWNTASGSRMLWIQGPFQASTPSRYTLLSTTVLATAQRASIPTISYFCKMGTDMVNMVYSLILQLVELIPYDFRSDLDFTSTRFDVLDRTMGSVVDAIWLLKDLLSVGPYMLFIIIDGLQVLENASNLSSLKEFLNVLSSVARRKDTNHSRTVKILFTTDGFVDTLTSLSMDERLDALDFTGEDDGSVEADGMEVGFL